MPQHETHDDGAPTPIVIQDEASLLIPHPDSTWLMSTIYRAARSGRIALEDGTDIAPDHQDR